MTKKLNIGAGPASLADYINADVMYQSTNQLVCDAEQPLPFRDGVFEEVFSNNMLIYLHPKRVIPFMNEVYRVLQPHGLAVFRCPAAPNFEAFCCPGTQSFWNEVSFHYFLRGHARCEWIREHQGFTGGFRALKLITETTRNLDQMYQSHVVAHLEKC